MQFNIWTTKQTQMHTVEMSNLPCLYLKKKFKNERFLLKAWSTGSSCRLSNYASKSLPGSEISPLTKADKQEIAQTVVPQTGSHVQGINAQTLCPLGPQCVVWATYTTPFWCSADAVCSPISDESCLAGVMRKTSQEFKTKPSRNCSIRGMWHDVLIMSEWLAEECRVSGWREGKSLNGCVSQRQPVRILFHTLHHAG